MCGLQQILFLSIGLAVQCAARLRLQSTRLFSKPDSLSLGAPVARPSSGAFTSPSGVRVDFHVEELSNPNEVLESLVDRINGELGVLLTSSYEVGRKFRSPLH